jgi:hypothetical protein
MSLLHRNRPQPEDDSPALTNRPQLGDDLRDAIFLIPWGHQKLLIDKCKNDRERAMFYVRKTLENNWSRDVLLNFLDTDLTLPFLHFLKKRKC